MKKIRIGVTTFHKAYNFGSALQAYALQKVLIKNNFEAKVINYIYKHDQKIYYLFRTYEYKKSPKTIISDILFLFKNIIRKIRFGRFLKKYINITKNVYYSSEDIKAELENFDGFICGSDQIWNTDCTEGVVPAYFLDFAKDSKKIRISYAPSIAHSYIDGKYISEFKNKLKNIDSISVREQTGKKILEGLTDKKISVVLDPTLLLDKNEWEELCFSKRLINEKYILVYMLEKNQEIVKYVNNISHANSLKIIYFNKRNFGYNNSKCMYTSGPREFLTLFRDAEYIITNSFHATVFSVIFQKKFCTFTTQKSYTRMQDLLNIIGISDRIYSNNFKIQDSIDYEKVYTTLQKEKEKSMKFLIDSLLKDKEN